MWGIEQSGSNTVHRLLQKRGQFVHGENFGVIGVTYPVHPLTMKESKYKYPADMHNSKKAANINDFEA